MRAGIVGIGPWGRNLARVLGNLAEVPLTAAFDRSDSALREVPLPVDCVRCGSYSELLDRVAGGVVVVATPPSSHARLAGAALEAGCHVFVEKPMALSRGDAAKMVRAARRSERVLMVGHLATHHPVVKVLQSELGRGRIGSVSRVHAVRMGRSAAPREEGPIWTLAPHDVSMLGQVLGEWPVEVVAEVAAPGTAELLLSYSSGTESRLTLSCDAPNKVRRLEVFGSDGSVRFKDDSAGGALEWTPDGTRQSFELDRELLQVEIEHFIAGVNGERVLTDGAEGRDVVTVLEACAEANCSAGMRVPIRYFPDGGSTRSFQKNASDTPSEASP